jgi:hypothetical protein
VVVLEVLGVLAIVGVIALWLWCIVDVLRHPASEFRAVGTRRAIWLVALVIFGPGMPVAVLVYLIAMRPRLRSISSMP